MVVGRPLFCVYFFSDHFGNSSPAAARMCVKAKSHFYCFIIMLWRIDECLNGGSVFIWAHSSDDFAIDFFLIRLTYYYFRTCLFMIGIVFYVDHNEASSVKFVDKI